MCALKKAKEQLWDQRLIINSTKSLQCYQHSRTAQQDEEGGMTSSFNPITADMYIPTLMLSLRQEIILHIKVQYLPYVL